MPSFSRLALVAALVLPGCGDPCTRLSAALCDGGEDAYCKQVDEWLRGRLIDPETKEPLAGQPREQMCTAIHGSVDIFNAYRFKAKQKLLGEPDFTVKSSTPAANKADPDPKPKPVDVKRAPTPPVEDGKGPPDAKAEPDDEIKPDERPGEGVD
ncbi:MAG: hypothetical protein JNL82_06130 [Myxococcales bacterium]|nr:hypothetical protein [Myxococcales bacterium]